MLKQIVVAAALLFALAGCGESPEDESAPGPTAEKAVLPAGAWRGVIEIQGQELPFQMEVAWPATDEPRVEFINGEERVPVDEVTISDDEVALVLPSFNTRMDLRAKNGKLAGTLTKINTGPVVQKMSVTLTPGETYRFYRMLKPPKINLSGRWRVMFHEPDGGNYPAVGEFVQNGSQLTGTFLTPTSDYRYLSGVVRDNRLYLSAWDGFHVFLFEAELGEDGTLKGDYWAGPSWHETWEATRDENATLPDMDKQTYLRDNNEKFDFTFPNLEGEKVSLSDPRFQDKVVVIQLAGSWCPNCADETRFLAPWYEKNRERGVEVLALMFEHFEEFDKAVHQVREWRQKFGVAYPTLVAGTSDKQQASSVLPQLNAFLAFPTTIFVGRDGRVARIHTGFNGPATDRYEEEITQFNATVDALLQEQD